MQTFHRSYRQWLFVLLFCFMLLLTGMSLLSRGVLASTNGTIPVNTILFPMILNNSPAGTIPGI